MKLLLVQVTRNKQGKPSRVQQTLIADSVRVGRGSDCKLFLPDPRVSLYHALIVRRDDDVFFMEAVGGTLMLAGAMERVIKLAPGQKILLGSFELNILPPEGEHELGIAWELKERMEDDLAAVKSHVRAGLPNTWMSKRKLSWAAALPILVAFLAWPTLNALQPSAIRSAKAKAALTADEAWDPGPLSSAHQGFARDCAQCHTVAFQHTKNAACETCHRAIEWHFARDTQAAVAMHKAVFEPAGSPTKCASCHRDHKGPMGLVRKDSQLCTGCHADLKSRVATTASPNITDFGKDHPPFRLAMRVPGKSGDATVVRVPQKAGSRGEQSNLKFPHEVHLAKRGVRGANGLVVMDCATCHVPDESGARFKPVTMKAHCQDCHSLEFEPTAPTRQVPHGSVDDVLESVSEFYAQAVLSDRPIDVVFQEGARRPGERLSMAEPAKRLAALAWANQKADAISQELMEVRLCILCHEISRVSTANGTRAGTNSTRSWKVEPVAITQRWFPKSRFPHVQHKLSACKECHDKTNSKSSADISIPDIKKCQSCHAGNEPKSGTVRGTCGTCHDFHLKEAKSNRSAAHPVNTPRNPTAHAEKVAVRQ